MTQRCHPAPGTHVIGTGTVCHAYKKRVLSPRADLPTGSALCGRSVHIRLHWPFGLRLSSDHGLLIRYNTAAAQSANLRTGNFQNCERLLGGKLLLAPFAVELP
jgi:hypothetical protein